MKKITTFAIGFIYLIALCIVCSLCSCESTQFAQNPDGTIFMNDGTLLSKYDMKEYQWTMPNGPAITKRIWNFDGERILQEAGEIYAAKALTDLYKSNNAADVSKTRSADSVSKTKINSDAAVKINESNNALEAATFIP